MRLIDYFDRGADLHPGRDCLHDGARGWTYRDVRATTHRVANGLLAAGLKTGDKVAVYSPNHAMAYAALLGIQRAGIVERRLHDRKNAAHRLGVRAELSRDEAESNCFEEFATIGHSIDLEISTPKPGFSVG